MRLLEFGADINAEDMDGDTPIMLAAANGHTGNITTDTPLMLESANGHTGNITTDTPLMLGLVQKK